MRIKVEIEIDDIDFMHIKQLGKKHFKELKEIDHKFWNQHVSNLGSKVIVKICRNEFEITKE